MSNRVRLKYLFFSFLTFLLGLGITYGIHTVIVSAHGGDTNLVHSCIWGTTGILRIVGASDNCGTGETAKDWPSTQPSVLAACAGCSFRYNVGLWEDKNYNNSNIDTIDFTSEETGLLEMSGVHFKDSTFGIASFHRVDLSDATFENSTFKTLNFTSGSSNYDAVAADVNFTGVHWNYGQTDHADFTGANFTNAVLKPNDVNYTKFNNANFTDATLEDTAIQNSNFTGATGLVAGNLTNVTWSNVTCPDDTNSNSHSNTCVGHFTP